MSKVDDPKKITLHFDSQGKITGYGSNSSAGTVVGANKTVGSIVINYRVIEEFAALGYRYSSLKVKNGNVILPFSSFLKGFARNAYKDIFHFRKNISLWLKRINQFFINSAIGQFIIVASLSGLAVLIIDIGSSKDFIKIKDKSDYLSFYVPVFASLLAISFGIIGINNAERRYKETRRMEISPVFLFEAKGTSLGLEGSEDALMVSSTKREHRNSDKEIVYGKFLIRNEGLGIAFNTWIFLEREDGSFNMSGSFTLCNGEKKELSVSAEKGQGIPIRVYAVSNDLDNNMVIVGAVLSINSRSQKSSVISNRYVRDHEFKYREINYAVKSFGRV